MCAVFIGKQKMNKKAVKCLVLAFLVLFPEIYAFAKETVTVGVFPRRNSSITVKMFMPMIKHLEKQTGYQIRLETAKDFPEFWRRVKKGRYDVVHYNQLHYILSNKFSDYEVFAINEEFGSSAIAPAIVVRKDSGIRTIKDLKGKNIVFGGGKLAFISNVGNRILLQEAGLNEPDYHWSFARNPPNATMAVYFKRADAAGIGSIGLDIPSIKSKINTDELTFLAVGDIYPHIPWAFSKKLDSSIKKKFKEEMMSISSSDKGKIVLRKAGMTGLVSSTDEDFEESRKSYKRYLDSKVFR